MDTGAKMPLNPGNEEQCFVEGHQRFTPTDACPSEIEMLKVIHIIFRFGEYEVIGSGLLLYILTGGTIKAAGIADPIDKQAGPTPFAAETATG